MTEIQIRMEAELDALQCETEICKAELELELGALTQEQKVRVTAVLDKLRLLVQRFRAI